MTALYLDLWDSQESETKHHEQCQPHVDIIPNGKTHENDSDCLVDLSSTSMLTSPFSTGSSHFLGELIMDQILVVHNFRQQHKKVAQTATSNIR